MHVKLMGHLVLASILIGGPLQGGGIENFSTFWKTEEKDPEIGILIAHDVPGVVLEVKGKYKIYDPYTNAFISTRYIGKRKFVQALSDGIKWGEEFPSVHQIQIVPNDPKTTTLVDGIEYKGVMTVYDIGGSISVVNHLPIDEYVKTILNSHYSTSLPKELAAALAILERTYTWEQLQKSPSRYFNIEKERGDYLGYAASLKNEDFSSAIANTQRMILVKEGKPLAINLFGNKQEKTKNFQPPLGEISFTQAIELAKNGKHAAQILSQAFPGSTISLTISNN